MVVPARYVSSVRLGSLLKMRVLDVAGHVDVETDRRAAESRVCHVCCHAQPVVSSHDTIILWLVMSTSHTI